VELPAGLAVAVAAAAVVVVGLVGHVRPNVGRNKLVQYHDSSSRAATQAV
jgi:hypothetical protein